LALAEVSGPRRILVILAGDADRSAARFGNDLGNQRTREAAKSLPDLIDKLPDYQRNR
jgi:hypothetical protein